MTTLTTAWESLRNPDCDNCDLHETAQYVCLVGRGPVPCDIMIVGEAPGKREDDIGKPFAGKSGKVLEQALASVNCSRDQVYITNVVKCRPPENSTPSKKHVKACASYLQQELEVVKPKFILLLGGTALAGVLGRGHSKITAERGKVQTLGEATVMATFHPAALLYSPKSLPLVEMDMTKFFRLTRGELSKVPKVKISRVWDKEDLKECVSALKKSKLISIDLETTALDPLTGDSAILCMSISDRKGHAWTIPLEHNKSPWKDKADRVYQALGPVLTDLKWVTQNGQFDLVWGRVFGGIAPEQIAFDTMVAGYLLDENMPHNLEYLVQFYLGIESYKDDSKNFGRDFPLGRMMRHNAKDAVYTRSLYFPMRQQLNTDPRLRKLFKYISMPGIMLAADMEENGILIDETRLVKARERIEASLETVTRKMNEMVPRSCRSKTPTNWGSPKQVSELLYSDDGLSLPVVIYTKTGKPSTGEKALVRLQDRTQLIGLLMQYRGHKQNLSFFLTGWKQRMKPDGRIHPKYRTARVVTGRFSSSDPNLHQVPRDPEIRGILRSQPGWSLGELDFSQIELRIAAEISRDKNMLRAFMTGEDIHLATARSILGVERIEKEQRKKAKAVNFGFLYGMSASGFKDYALEKFEVVLTAEEAQEYRDRFFGTYRQLLPWHKSQITIARELGYVRSPLGRIRHLPDIYSPDKKLRSMAERQAINSPVQGTATDFTVLGGSIIKRRHDLEFSRLRPSIRFISIIHDALLMEIKNEYLEYWVPIIKSTLENLPLEKLFGVKLRVPIVVEAKSGTHWGLLKPWVGSQMK